MLTRARWTHVAIPSSNLDRTIAFFTEVTPLVVVHRHEDEYGQAAWLSNPDQVEDPFVLVVAMFYSAQGKPQPTLAPFAHIGIEVPTRDDVDAVAEKGRALGCLSWEPQDMHDPIGYICALKDPDGNVIEFSHNQKVFDTIRDLWGTAANRA
jgi:catechol 2,3-dioxygenase-like lactoylglutathione lyase family enzyme